MATGAAIAGIVIGAYQTDKSQEATEDYREAQNKRQRQIAAGKGVKERREIARAARIQRARIINQSTLQGTNKSSSALSAVGSINSQAADNTATSFANQALSSQSSNLLGQAAQYSSNANLANAIAGFSAGFIKPKTT